MIGLLVRWRLLRLIHHVDRSEDAETDQQSHNWTNQDTDERGKNNWQENPGPEANGKAKGQSHEPYETLNTTIETTWIERRNGT